MNKQQLQQLQKILSYTFKDESVLNQALIHRSCLNQKKYVQSNERMEFLGDAVLELIISHHLYTKLESSQEGVLTSNRSAIVRTESLAEIANSLNLGDYIIMSKGEEVGGGRTNPSLLANTTEAVTGAIYLDGGFDAAVRFVNLHIIPKVKDNIKDKPVKDSKSLLQEKVQSHGFESPVYKQVASNGPDHARTFTVSVSVNGRQIAKGSGKSKRLAEQNAAQIALKLV